MHFPQQKQYSLVRRISIGLICTYAILLIIMMLSNAFSIRTIRQNVCDQLADTLVQENRRITDNLYSTSSYLSSLSLNASNLSIIAQNKQDSEYYSALYKLKTELNNTLASLSDMHGLFAFSFSNQQFIYASSNDSAAKMGNTLAVWIREQYESGALDSYVSPYWFTLSFDDHYYLARILRNSSGYLGAWTDFSQLFSNISPTDSLETIALFAYNEENVFDARSLMTDYHISLSETEQNYQFLNLDHKYIAVSQKTSYTKDGAIYLLVRYNRITSQLRNSYLLFAVSGAIFILLAIAAVIYFQQNLLASLIQLQDSLSILRNGDFSVRLTEFPSCKEFTDVNTAFNQMVERIENLKINVYEEKLNQQRTEMPALKNQIAPHFLINCLNTIYHMSAARNMEGIQHMAVYLGEHLRYALADVSTVPLSDELEKTENYVKLSKVRFPDSIELYIDMDDSLKGIPVPPMILLFQVENIIKYEIVNGVVTEIHLEACRTDAQDSGKIHFSIWDTGSGYAADVLSQLCDKEMLSQADGHNIGTRNIYQRLHLIFGENFSMKFSNKPGAGAQVDIFIPDRADEGSVL